MALLGGKSPKCPQNPIFYFSYVANVPPGTMANEDFLLYQFLGYSVDLKARADHRFVVTSERIIEEETARIYAEDINGADSPEEDSTWAHEVQKMYREFRGYMNQAYLDSRAEL
eukprot:3310267-Pyramimonas_sp.AAC.1